MMVHQALITLAVLLGLSICSATKILPRGEYLGTQSRAFRELRDVIVHPRGEYSGELPQRLNFPARPLMRHASTPQDSAAAVKRTLLGKRQDCNAGYGYCYGMHLLSFDPLLEIATDVSSIQHPVDVAQIATGLASVATMVLVQADLKVAASTVAPVQVVTNAAKKVARPKAPTAAGTTTIATQAISVAGTVIARPKVVNAARTLPALSVLRENSASYSMANRPAAQISAAVRKPVKAAEEAPVATAAVAAEAERRLQHHQHPRPRPQYQMSQSHLSTLQITPPFQHQLSPLYPPSPPASPLLLHQ